VRQGPQKEKTRCNEHRVETFLGFLLRQSTEELMGLGGSGRTFNLRLPGKRAWLFSILLSPLNAILTLRRTFALSAFSLKSLNISES
jgi:hypothetical protein